MKFKQIYKFAVIIFSLCFYLSSFAFETKATSAIVVDMTNNTILYEKNANKLIPPASMSKMMTAYVVFSEIKKNNLKLEDEIIVPQDAVTRGGVASGSSSMLLNAGQRVSVDILLQGLLVASGNDAAITLATHISGSEEKFAEEMNRYAKKLGLKASFGNSTGLSHPKQLMSPKDIAFLAKAIYNDFPQYFKYFSQKTITFNGVTQKNRNELLFEDSTIDGLKTGYTSEAGYCLAASANRNGRRLVSVVTGLTSAEERIEVSKHLLEYSYNNFQWNWFFSKTEPIVNVDILSAKKSSIGLVAKEQVKIFINKNELDNLAAYVVYQKPLTAPISRNDVFGSAFIIKKDSGDLVASVSLYPNEDILPLSGFSKLRYNIGYYLNKFKENKREVNAS